MTRFNRKILESAQPMLSRYSATNIVIDDDHTHPIAHVTMTTGIVVRVHGIPRTTSTDAKHVGQNILKYARVAARLSKSAVAYSGGS